MLFNIAFNHGDYCCTWKSQSYAGHMTRLTDSFDGKRYHTAEGDIRMAIPENVEHVECSKTNISTKNRWRCSVEALCTTGIREIIYW